jgi:hypothetical protein
MATAEACPLCGSYLGCGCDPMAIADARRGNGAQWAVRKFPGYEVRIRIEPGGGEVQCIEWRDFGTARRPTLRAPTWAHYSLAPLRLIR